MGDFAHLRDVVGQLPFLKTYSHILLAFELKGYEESKDETTKCLQTASLKLTEAFPWLATKVVNRCSGPGNSGLFELEPCALWSPPNTVLRVKDCSSLCPPCEDIVRRRGPCTMLDGGILGPRKAFPESYEETEDDPTPVLAFQANFIRGGLLLDCAAQHNFIDMNGIEQCESTKDHSQFKRPAASEKPPLLLRPNSPFFWRYFRFSAHKLKELKARAMPSEGCDPSVSYISTNDALTAFCWQRVTTVRLRRHQTPHATAKFCRAVDAWNTMGVPPGYMGDLVTIATSRMTFKDLVDAPLSVIAGVLRRDLNAVDTPDYIRSFATHIANTPDKSTIVYGGKLNPDTDIGSSPWARIQLCRVTFGPLGKPALIRRPNFGPIRSDIYFISQLKSGDIDALLCFNEEDMDELIEEEEWSAYADYIG
ncbi:transferase family-domain-containing protein [Durotheca rogersii]|uniref:transferase family-domain-containing protein n=1 Tax=Durotheca rogersii TaxID=419775 RepID=UPI00221FE2E5|nr:transferase family-domain-containing protein [Durotheca rogersii]KAI5853647.1 transferase family-domain-containing protein [Durotheca rogersii]